MDGLWYYGMVMKDQIAILISDILKEMGTPGAAPEVEVPEDAGHGDYTTNVAMILAKTLKKAPMEIALQVAEEVKSQKSKVKSEGGDQNIGKHSQTSSASLASLDTLQAIDRVEVALPGFINIFLTEASLSSNLIELLKQKEVVKTGSAKRVMVEYAHPNTHKAFHIGHLRNITTGESIIRLLESQGNEVIRANYQGDVGMHIAKALYALLKLSAISDQLSAIKKVDIKSKVEFLGKAYAAGSKAFEEDAAAKEEIGEINKKIYAKDPAVYGLYRQTRQWSLDYFEAIYRRVGSRFDRYYFESEVYEPGKKLVRAGLEKGIFEESDGAIIFRGAKYGLHNRVFVTGEDNATYEGKELALSTMETAEHGKIDRLIHVVGPEQASCFQVTFKAEELLGIVKPGVQYHLVYGWVKLKHGKMSSRSGNVVLGEWLLDEAKKAIYSILDNSESKYTKGEQEEIAEKAAIAAVKYAFLKVGTTSEIAFDIKESVNFQGDSGPYLQYTYARARSVLRKARGESTKHEARNSKQIPNDEISKIPNVSNLEHLNFNIVSDFDIRISNLNVEERNVCRLLTYFPDVVAQAAAALSPSALCTYLFKLAQAYNLFYAKHQIIGSSDSSERSDQATLRLSLTAATAQVLKNGLYLLGIETLEQM